MKTNLFPLNYFQSIWTPTQAFKNRRQLNWFHLVVVLIFLNGLMLIPVTFNYLKADFYPLLSFYPHTVKIINDQAVNNLNRLKYKSGEVLIETPFLKANEFGVIGGGLDLTQKEEILAKEDNVILFERNQFTLKEKNKPLATVLYTKDFSLAGLQDSEAVVNELSRQWFNQNRILFVLIFSLLISSFLFGMLLFTTFGAAFFLYLTKNSPMTSITTYKEAVNLVVNVLTLPTVAAMIFSLIHFDVTLMVTIQNLGLVGMLLILFYKTNFNDRHLPVHEFTDI